jgi:peptide/nickel transport system substrate-binding protein
VLNRRVGRRSLLRGATVALSATALGGLAAACSSAAPPTNTPAPAAKPTEAPKPAATTAPAAATSAPAAGAASPAAGATTAAGGATPAAAATTAPAAGAASPAAGAAAGGKRGGGGTLKLLLWQAPTILNPHLATGTKDIVASRIVLEPLFTVDGKGTVSPVLAAEVPTKQNGGLGDDGKTVTIKLKQGVKWADGSPFTSEDVVFTYQYLINKETAATSIGPYLEVDKVEGPDPNTVKITFKNPTPAWFTVFTGGNGWILPKSQLKDNVGPNAKNAPFNLKPMGTGPYVVDDFKPGDLVVYKPNPNYRDPSKPYFDQIQLKGGGDAVSAARAVLQTGEYDYAWNLQVEWPVLQDIEKGGKGTIVTASGSGVEQLYFNFTDPNKEVDGERSSLKAPHPFLTDPKVREAMALAIDRDTMAKQLYGGAGDPSPNVLTTPTDYASKNTKYEFNIQKANQMLDDAGYKKGADGIRVTKDGVRMKVTYATSINTLRQKEQALVKDGWSKIGIDCELKSVDAGVYFGGDVGQPDNINHFYWDTMMYTSTFGSPFPIDYMKQWYSGDPARDVAQKANGWQGTNRNRWINADYNKLWEAAAKETDPAKSKQLFMQMNDMVVNNFVSVPFINRNFVSATSKALKGLTITPFDAETWNIADWTKA